jgi:uncharacterized protein YecE (DUF72 family)
MAADQLGFEFGDPSEPPMARAPRAAALRDPIQDLARRGALLGTSSWKYPGWLGQLYRAERYQAGGRYSQRKFERTCLSEYAEVFPTVGGDFSFYQFPSDDAWHHIFAQLPVDYAFSLKVPEEITVARFGTAPRYGPRAGHDNGHFMDATMVREALLGPLERYRDQLGVVMFEFGALRRPWNEPSAFTERLDRMLSDLPTDRFRFGVEIRNSEFLGPAYFDCLSRHGVTHVLNNWTRMPPIGAQMRMSGALTASHVAARFLLKPGRTYQQAVEMFQPYEAVRDVYPEGREAIRQLIERCLAESRTLFAYINNRFEGSALGTIEGVLDED